MAKGFDCATPLTHISAKQFRADGFEFVCRYLVPSGWKRLTKKEAGDISAAGLKIVSVFETTASRALGGRTAGLNDGRIAIETAAVVGQPKGSRIYFAVDFDATASQMDKVLEYIKAARETATAQGYTAGVYGSAAVVEAAMKAQACTGFWQTYAWSRGRKVEGIHIYQYDNGPKGLGKLLNNVNVDLDIASGNVGWWDTLSRPEVQNPLKPGETQEVKERMLNKEDANKVIGFLKAAYEAVEQREAREELHRLANELRKASGQVEEN
ncbi:DUF1906 domain-containing protein [Paenibacillus sp. M1]|uniref:DUF1906 domain-containing protein n=1 Tax=Paenibacillus haidiansis TaxID=1574488 RepID=A0ABU7VVI4_9BACL